MRLWLGQQLSRALGGCFQADNIRHLVLSRQTPPLPVIQLRNIFTPFLSAGLSPQPVQAIAAVTIGAGQSGAVRLNRNTLGLDIMSLICGHCLKI